VGVYGAFPLAGGITTFELTNKKAGYMPKSDRKKGRKR